MSWFIINAIGAGLSILSLGALIVTMRKLAGTIRLGRELAYQIKLATLNLDQAGSLLRQEHQNFRNENYKLDTRVRETIRIRHDIGRSLEQMQQMHQQLQKKFSQLNNTSGAPAKHPYHANAIPINTTTQPQKHERNGLPVFVRRKVSKAALKSVTKP